MKISLSWLNDYLKTGLTPQETGTKLTACGLEVESIEDFESVAGGLRGLVVGEVVEKIKHPNADKLSLTRVNVGGAELLSIVCGAPNVEAGQKVIVAAVGTMVHPTTGEPFEIKKSKIRGELSEGMICAEDEIGLGESHAGIMILDANAKVGTPAAEFFGLANDHVFEIGLTPNRADAASHFGVARDLSAVLLAEELQKNPLAEHQPAVLPPANAFGDDLPDSSIEVELLNPEACIRYSGIVINGIEVKASPDWLQNRLKAIGLRPINNVVDVTNYVLHEIGQPLHAFDADKISGKKVVVKKGAAGTKFISLEGTERKLSENDLMICDAEKPMCIAGVFGGLDSGVTETTTSIFLESACFEPVHVRKTSKFHTLKTDASFRFERGTDPEITVYALQRAAKLLQEMAGGEVASKLVDIYPVKVEPKEVAFAFSNCDTLIGKSIEHNTIKKILRALGIEIASEGQDALLLSVPAFKVDVTRSADVVEEVLRIYGYNNISFPEFVRSSLSYAPKPDPEKLREIVSELLAANGFSEILNNSLTKSAYYDLLKTDAASNVAILNPLSSDLGILRRSLLFGGLETIAYNQKRKNPDLRLFESGKTYFKKANTESSSGERAPADKEGKWPYFELQRFAFFVTGRKNPESWNASNEKAGFFDLKSTVQQVLTRLGLSESKTDTIEAPEFSEGLKTVVRKKEVVRYGRVAKNIIKALDISGDVFYAEFDWDAVLSLAASSKEIHFTEVPKFPSVRRDLALVLDKKVSYKEVEELAWQTEKNLLREVNLFDVYEGDKIAGDKKSYALSFILQDNDATLTDAQIEKIMEKLTKNYSEKLGAVIRA
ncbi:MAG: phenylalanine--tRNA ligase subunit beta [Bacteroidota bacterium]|nr:phenylalanine--tRNA ligase subunit beta [Bacteroidota bacterium]